MQRNVSKGMINQAASQNATETFLDKGAVRTGVLLQLFLTHGITAAIALTIVSVFTQLKANPSMSIIGVIVISGGIGLLLTANLSYQLHLAERAVTRMSQGQTATIPAFSWPLTRLFTNLHALDRRIQMYIRGEQAAAEVRRHYLQKASETATQTERQRIARDLHDSIKQQLFSISVSAAAVKAYLSKDLSKAQAAIADIQRVTKEAQVEMQALLQQLGSTPLENTKLADALRTQAEALKYRSGLEVELTIGDIPAEELLPEGTQETIFRLVQEAFANIARHARAKAVTVSLQQSARALHLIVCDNGKGFDARVAHAGMGLTNMRERVATLNGTIEVQSGPEQGTRLHILIPFIQLQEDIDDKARNEHDFRRGVERATRGFQIGYTAQGIAALFIVINTSNSLVPQIPIIAIVMCVLVTCYGLVQGHSWKTRVAQYKDKENLDVLLLQQREEKLLGGLLLTSFLGGLYFLHLQKGWNDIYTAIFIIIITVLLVALLVLYLWRGYQTQGRIYRLTPPDEARLEITHHRRRITRSVRLLFAGAMAVGLFLVRMIANPQSVNIGIWSLLAFGLLIGGGIVLGNFAILRQQQRVLDARDKKSSSDSIFAGE